MPSLGTYMFKRTAISAALVLGALGLFAVPANAQIATSTELDGAVYSSTLSRLCESR